MKQLLIRYKRYYCTLKYCCFDVIIIIILYYCLLGRRCHPLNKKLAHASHYYYTYRRITEDLKFVSKLSM